MKPASIYVLIDPRDAAVRYVGWTTQSLTVRCCQHVCQARIDLDQTHRARWIRQLLRAGLRPRIELVESVSTARGPSRERYWIKLYRSVGARLVNGTDGGDGTPGRRRSATTVALWRRVRLAYARTRSIRGAAAEVGLSKNGVAHALQVMRVPRLARNRCGVDNSSRKAINPDSPNGLVRNESLMYALYQDQRRSIPEIAKMIGVSRTTVLTGLQQCGISRRSKSEALLCKFRSGT